MTTIAKLKEGELKIAGEIEELIDETIQPTFTRASTAYKEDGSVVNAGVPRIVNKETTNLMTTSEQIFPSDMIELYGGTLDRTDSVTVAEWNTTNATRIIMTPSTTSSSTTFVFKGNATMISGVTYTYSLLIKNNGTSSVSCGHPNSGILSPSTSAYIPVGGIGRYYFSCTGTSSISMPLKVKLAANLVNTVLDVVIYQPQVEVKNYATSYEPYPEGVLIEEGTTNLLPSGSYDFHNAGYPLGWYSNGGAIITVTGQQVDPYGGTGAYRIQTSGGSATGKYNIMISDLPKGATVSLWAKVNSGTARIRDDFGGIPVATDITTSWHKIVYTTTTRICKPCFATLAITDNIDITVMQPQVEQKDYTTSYIPPQSTRSAETLEIPSSALSVTEGTIEFDYTPINQPLNDITLQEKSPKIMQVGDYATKNSLTLWKYPYNGVDIIRLYGNRSSGWILNAVTTYSFSLLSKYRFSLRWKTANTFDLFINGVCIISNAMSSVAFTAMGNIKFGDTNSSGAVNAIYSNIRISNKARSDTELAYTGALSVDEYTTYLLPCKEDLVASSTFYPHFRLSLTGGLKTTSILTEQPKIPSDVYYYPLTFDGKDSTHNFSPSEATNLVYSRDGVWVGTATQNYYTGIAPTSVNGGTASNSTQVMGEYGFIFNGAETWKFVRDGTTEQFHGWSGVYNNWIAGDVGAGFTSSGFYKTTNKAGINTLPAFIPYTTDWATAIGNNINNIGLTIKDDGKWNYYSSSCALTQASSGAIANFPWTSSVEANTSYYHAQMWEKKPFPSPFCATTRGAGSLEYNFNSSLGLDWNGDWTICYWKKPMGTSNDTLTGFSVESLGESSNSVGGGYAWWGKNTASNTLYAVGGGVGGGFAGSFSSYFNKWHMISIIKNGTTCTVKFWGIDGSTLVKTYTYGTLASNYYVTQYGYDFKLGGYSNGNPTNSYYKDLVVAKRALTDDELFALYKTQIKSYNSGILQVRNGISEGDIF